MRRLEDEQLIEEEVTEQSGAYPQRTVYRITNEGRRVFLDLLRNTCRTVHEPKYPIDLALVFIGQLAPGERVAMLQKRLSTLESTQEDVREKRAQLDGSGRQFASLQAVLDHDLMLREAEIRWMRQLIDKVPDWPEAVVPGIGRED